ncbi:alpha/beta fold hydrolase [Janthinobacterium agaricidamnosum]|uniref:Alpha/beta hydrolase fold family protein n=1 Tax=Janthinobacterium agaricidamnosum NBRC 102515 = DSM 9628 TaxID=1349767 RepID=W0VAV5_9BURK|nr:alpha/beta hydrolase [Janthinobacterium agaricidamnosum]CDG85929.1 alpha/beta hydrolase fold family protein [Janthinobacterium agaricidamnosum NBRC 102515 = DSM 9628]
MMHWFKRAFISFIAAVSASTPLSAAATEQLDDAARQELLQSGSAQQFVKLPLGIMHVRADGPLDGPVVLLVHGGVVGGFGFEKWRKPLADAGFRVLVPDLFGYGYSDRPKLPYTRQFYVDQIRQLLDALEIREPVAIVGASLGGAIVTAFTAQAPARVRSVVLMAPAGGGRVPVVNPVLLWPVVGDTVFHFFGASNMRTLMDKAYADSPDRASMAQWMASQTRYRGFAEGVLNTLRNYDAAWQPDDYAALGQTGIPVLALWGTADTVNPYAQAQVLARAVPQMKIVPLEGKGHAITFGASEQVLDAVLPFLKTATAQRSADWLSR